ncbi:MAG: hypothetical protein JWO31_716 [Phycisphaerales bacterium]|nr:hypothetical protein [Phycisphaerales bacterium]
MVEVEGAIHSLFQSRPKKAAAMIEEAVKSVRE